VYGCRYKDSVDEVTYRSCAAHALFEPFVLREAVRERALFGHESEDRVEEFDELWRPSVGLAQRWHLARRKEEERARFAERGVRRLAFEHFDDGDRDAPNVGRIGVLLGQNHFGRHIPARAGAVHNGSHRHIDAQAEVDEFHIAFGRQHYIAWLKRRSG
jgi:hypothetical protein